MSTDAILFLALFLMSFALNLYCLGVSIPAKIQTIEFLTGKIKFFEKYLEEQYHKQFPEVPESTTKNNPHDNKNA